MFHLACQDGLVHNNKTNKMLHNTKAEKVFRYSRGTKTSSSYCAKCATIWAFAALFIQSIFRIRWPVQEYWGSRSCSKLSTIKLSLLGLAAALNAIALDIWIGQSDCSHQQVSCNKICPHIPSEFADRSWTPLFSALGSFFHSMLCNFWIKYWWTCHLIWVLMCFFLFQFGEGIAISCYYWLLLVTIIWHQSGS